MTDHACVLAHMMLALVLWLTANASKISQSFGLSRSICLISTKKLWPQHAAELMSACLLSGLCPGVLVHRSHARRTADECRLGRHRTTSTSTLIIAVSYLCDNVLLASWAPRSWVILQQLFPQPEQTRRYLHGLHRLHLPSDSGEDIPGLSHAVHSSSSGLLGTRQEISMCHYSCPA